MLLLCYQLRKTESKDMSLVALLLLAAQDCVKGMSLVALLLLAAQD